VMISGIRQHPNQIRIGKLFATRVCSCQYFKTDTLLKFE